MKELSVGHVCLFRFSDYVGPGVIVDICDDSYWIVFEDGQWIIHKSQINMLWNVSKITCI